MAATARNVAEDTNKHALACLKCHFKNEKVSFSFSAPFKTLFFTISNSSVQTPPHISKRCDMNIPGFNAETSLHKGKTTYHSAFRAINGRANNSDVAPQTSSSYQVGCCNAGTAAQITKWIGDYQGWCHIDYYLGTPCTGFQTCVDAATCDPLLCNKCSRWY
jgi:hypothetical protein